MEDVVSLDYKKEYELKCKELNEVQMKLEEYEKALLNLCLKL